MKRRKNDVLFHSGTKPLIRKNRWLVSALLLCPPLWVYANTDIAAQRALSHTHKTAVENSATSKPDRTKGLPKDFQPDSASEIMSKASQQNTQAMQYSLAQLLEIAKREHPAIAAARAQALGARAAITTAGAYPNPELELQTGRNNARISGAAEGTTSAFAIAQKIENPSLRSARTASAEAGARAANIAISIAEANVIAEVKVRYFNVLRREQEVIAAREDKALTEQIRDRVKVRVETGESARFDLIRADTEVANAAKQLDAAILRLLQAKAILRQGVSLSLADDFSLNTDLPKSLSTPDYSSLKNAFESNNPELKKTETEIRRAERLVDVEQQSVMPSVIVRLGQGREPDIRSSQIGVALSIPIWDRRQGPIAQANAELVRHRNEAELRKLELGTGFSAAWSQYQAAAGQVNAIENTILVSAKRSLDIAESAYRLGERGILEFLDAQRQFRLTRNELINARYELQVARAELERLAGRDLVSYEDISPVSHEKINE